MRYGHIYELHIGNFFIMEENGKIVELSYQKENERGIRENCEMGQTPVLQKAAEELEEYFVGKRKTFDLPLAPKGTEFQQKVWKALCTIPYGQTRSYKDIAIQVGNERACRAVGMANNRNPIMIMIPCHRVIGANGKLVGYGGGLDVKEKLLSLEHSL